MADKRLVVETLSELQIWIEGQFALILQAQTTSQEEMRSLRIRVHDLAGDIAKIIALNLPEKLLHLEKADLEHETNIKKFITEAAERRGMVAALKATYAVVGALIGGLVASYFKLFEALK